MILCIDSNVVIWGIKRQSRDDQKHMIERALSFFDWADKEKHTIMIPTIVLAEILSPESPSKRVEFNRVIHKGFMVSPFDSISANVFAELMSEKHPDINSYLKTENLRKEKMKFDMAIIASALANGAERIYTNNIKDFEKFSLGRIGIYDLPPVFKQSAIQFEEP